MKSPNDSTLDNMIKINVDPSSIVSILNNMSNKIKEQEKRMVFLEKQIQLFVPYEQYTKEMGYATELSSSAMKQSSEAVTQVNAYQSKTLDTVRDIYQTIDNKTNEAIVTINMAQKGMIDSIHQQINETHSQLKQTQASAKESSLILKQHSETLKEMAVNTTILGERIHHVNSELIKHVNQSQALQAIPIKANEPKIPPFDPEAFREELKNFSNRVARVEQRQKQITENEIESSQRYQRMLDGLSSQFNERVTSLQKTMEIIMAKPAPAPPRSENGSNAYSEVWNVLNQNRATILNAITEQNLISQRVSELQGAIRELQSRPVSHENTSSSIKQSIIAHQQMLQNVPLDNDIRVKEHKQLATTVNGLGDAMAAALQDITKIKSTVNRNEKDIRDVVMAFMDEFKLIRTNASGLEHLPPLNLTNCVPSFFNNPSFTFDRDESACSTPCESDRDIYSNRTADYAPRRSDSFYRKTQSDEELPSAISQPKPKKISGLLHLISRPDGQKKPPKRSTSDYSLKTEVVDTINEVAELQHTKQPHPEDRVQVVENYRQDVISSSQGTERVTKTVIVYDKESTEEIKKLFDKFSGEKDQLMLAVDRKVDRDMVERLFDKFRTLISSLNEKIKEMASMMGHFAKQKDVEAVAEVVAHMPEITERSVGIKKGPECLFCGRARSQLAGQISPRSALCGGGVTVSIQTVGDNSSNLIYGDGGAFIGGGSRMESFPHFQLPPLKEKPKQIVNQ